MPLNDVKKILLKANTDSEYRARFFDREGKSMDEWAAGLGNYKLTGEEKQCLYGIRNEDQLSSCSERVGETDLISDIRI